MSEPTAAPAVATAPAAPAAKPLNAIQIIEQEIAGFFKQKEQAIANVHAIDGAIQAGQVMLGKLKAAAAAAEAEVKKLATEAEAEAKKLLGEAETEVTSVETKVVDFVKKEL